MTTLLWWLPAGITTALTAHTWVNARLLPRPSTLTSTVDSQVSVLLPVRDEALRVGPCLAALMAQTHVPQLQIVVLDDGSTDGTAELVRTAIAADPRVSIVDGAALPPGWLGKPHACAQLAAHASGDILVFVDADVVLAPTAIAAAVGLLDGVDLVSPYPRLVAVGPAERLVQPLLPWSWLTFLPVRAMERSRRPSLAAAGGQFLAVTRAGYDRAGGHAAVRAEVLEDLGLARAVKRSGGRIRLADGSRVATCRMYESWAQLRDGYRKSLWAAAGPPPAAATLGLLLTILYVLPAPVALVAAGLGAWSIALAATVAYLCGVLGRAITARATGGRWWPDAFAHPASVALLGWLTIGSHRRRRRGTLRWKDRTVTVSTVDGR